MADLVLYCVCDVDQASRIENCTMGQVFEIGQSIIYAVPHELSSARR